jgi:hypothetical protein
MGRDRVEHGLGMCLIRSLVMIRFPARHKRSATWSDHQIDPHWEHRAVTEGQNFG